MLSAISAEALKFTRHRATWGLVWIWPIGLLAIYVIIFVLGAIGVEGSGPDTGPTVQSWIADATAFWNVPPHTFGRYVTGAFVAVVFAGEYGWNTWKLIVPHRARTSLIGAKYVTSFALLAAGFAIAALLMNGLGWLEDVVTGDPIPAGVTAGAVAQAHALGAIAALPPMLFTIASVSLAAILTRSTVGALVIGLVVTTLEELFRGFGPLLEPSAPTLVGFFYQILPGYHVANLSNWVGEGIALQVPFASGLMATPWPTSLAIVAAWIVGLVALTLWRFRRQDLN